MEVTSLIDIKKVVERLHYGFPEYELNFYPTFEVSRESYINIQNEVHELSMQVIPKIPYEQKDSWMSFNYMGIKCLIKPKQ